MKRPKTDARDRKRRWPLEHGKGAGYYIRGAARLLIDPKDEDLGKVTRQTKPTRRHA